MPGIRPPARNCALRRLVSGITPGKRRIGNPARASCSLWESSSVKTGWENTNSAPASILALSHLICGGMGRAIAQPAQKSGGSASPSPLMIRPSRNPRRSRSSSTDERTSVTRCARLPRCPMDGASPVTAKSPRSPRSQPPISEECRRIRLDCVTPRWQIEGMSRTD